MSLWVEGTEDWITTDCEWAWVGGKIPVNKMKWMFATHAQVILRSHYYYYFCNYNPFCFGRWFFFNGMFVPIADAMPLLLLQEGNPDPYECNNVCVSVYMYSWEVTIHFLGMPSLIVEPCPRPRTWPRSFYIIWHKNQLLSSYNTNTTTTPSFISPCGEWMQEGTFAL